MPSSVVIDASAFVELLRQCEKAPAVAHAITGADMVGPDVFNVEVLRALRRLEQMGDLSQREATQAAEELTIAPVERLPTAPFLPVAWSLRANVSVAGACYVAAARVLGAPLVTADHRLARAPGLKVPVIAV